MLGRTILCKVEGLAAALVVNRGQGIIEYSLIIVLVVIAAVLSLSAFGQGVFGMHSGIANDLLNAFNHP